ncbi:MAG: hypothetical protein ACR2HW_02315 [Gemmatimonadales bacterium]
MKVLIIADVHGNLEALKAVLADPHHAVSSGTTWRVALSSAPEALVNHGMAMLARPTGSSRWQFQLLPGCIRVERTVAALERSGAEPAAAAVLTQLLRTGQPSLFLTPAGPVNGRPQAEDSGFYIPAACSGSYVESGSGVYTA